MLAARPQHWKALPANKIWDTSWLNSDQISCTPHDIQWCKSYWAFPFAFLSFLFLPINPPTWFTSTVFLPPLVWLLSLPCVPFSWDDYHLDWRIQPPSFSQERAFPSGVSTGKSKMIVKQKKWTRCIASLTCRIPSSHSTWRRTTWIFSIENSITRVRPTFFSWSSPCSWSFIHRTLASSSSFLFFPSSFFSRSSNSVFYHSHIRLSTPGWLFAQHITFKASAWEIISKNPYPSLHPLPMRGSIQSPILTTLACRTAVCHSPCFCPRFLKGLSPLPSVTSASPSSLNPSTLKPSRTPLLTSSSNILTACTASRFRVRSVAHAYARSRHMQWWVCSHQCTACIEHLNTFLEFRRGKCRCHRSIREYHCRRLKSSKEFINVTETYLPHTWGKGFFCPASRTVSLLVCVAGLLFNVWPLKWHPTSSLALLGSVRGLTTDQVSKLMRFWKDFL